MGYRLKFFCLRQSGLVILGKYIPVFSPFNCWGRFSHRAAGQTHFFHPWRGHCASKGQDLSWDWKKKWLKRHTDVYRIAQTLHSTTATCAPNWWSTNWSCTKNWPQVLDCANQINLIRIFIIQPTNYFSFFFPQIFWFQMFPEILTILLREWKAVM